MNTSKLRQPAATGTSKIPVKRPPVTVSTGSTTTTKPKPVPTITQSTKPVPTITQPAQSTTPKQHKLESTAPKVHDIKPQSQSTQLNNKENKENISLNSTKKLPDAKVKGYTELRKNEERLVELVNRFELEKQNHAQQILAIEQKHQEELRAKDEIIRTLQYQIEAAQKRTQKAENELNTLQEELSTLSTRNKSLETLLEEVNVDVVALQRISTVVNTEDIEHRFQEFTSTFESEYEISMKCIRQKEELLCQTFEISVPEWNEEEVEEVEKEILNEGEKEGLFSSQKSSTEAIEIEEDSATHAMEVECL